MDAQALADAVERGEQLVQEGAHLLRADAAAEGGEALQEKRAREKVLLDAVLNYNA